MKDKITQRDDNNIKTNKEMSEKTLLKMIKKPIKGSVDLFVFALVIFFLLVDLIVLSNETLIEGSAILSFIVEYTTTVFVILLVNRVRKDPKYNYVYFFLGVLSSLAMEIIASILINNYLEISGLYTETIIKGFLRAFIWGYFYRSFKRYSMKKLFG